MKYSIDSDSYHASATDLANHARCEHLTQRARAQAIEIAHGRAQRTEHVGLAVDKGIEFEAAFVQRCRSEVEAAGGRFAEARTVEQRDAALSSGVELIAQVPLRSGTVFGYADLLTRVDDAVETAGSLQTVHRYEPVEIKLGRSVRPEYLLQASAYADALVPLLGELPARIHVVTGDGTKHTHPSSEYVAYFQAARTRFAEALALDLPPELARLPEPVSHCPSCEFLPICSARWRDADHLSLVAGIRSDQRTKLTTHGISTLTALATSTLDKVPSISARSFQRMHTQARLQLESRTRPTNDPAIAWRDPALEPAPAGRGFAMLPDPDDEDMFFDFEGYPYHASGALEYLWGWTTREQATGTLRFEHLWADTSAEEGIAFSRFLDIVHERWERSPGMHVYHYAPYEITALRRLAHQHHHEQHRLDQLLRAGVFVDLYAVVRQALQIGTESYSIKQLEPLYGVDRSGDELADGGSSIEVYEQYLAGRDAAIRATILDYNRVDCDSTLLLRDWLLQRRADAEADGITWPAVPTTTRAEDGSDEDSAAAADDDPQLHPTTVLVQQLEHVADSDEYPDDVRTAARLLSAMPGWQRRTRREFFGDLYGRMHDRDSDDYVREPTALGGLKLIATEDAGRGTIKRTYRFPTQVTLVKEGHEAIDPTCVRTVGEVCAVDLDADTVTIKTIRSVAEQARDHALRSGDDPDAVPTAIVGWSKIPLHQLEPAAREIGQWLLDQLQSRRDPFAPKAPYAAALSMLARHATRTTSGAGPETLDHDATPEQLADLVQRCEGSHVIVQGPPGTGKTWTSARLVVRLVEAGLRVGISSNSHDAVINVMRGIDEHLAERSNGGAPVQLHAAYKLRTSSGERAPGTFGFGDEWIERPASSSAAVELLASGAVQVLAGTAWQFTKDAPLDVMLIDEAGQVSLLHATAMASSARRVVLVGDPQQLPQPSDATHPHGCDASVLEHLFEGAAVLPPERAVLLPVTRRMHPDVCEHISTSYYSGALEAHPSTAVQHVTAQTAAAIPTAGVHLLTVDHHGNRSSSTEEVAAISALVAQLLASGRTVPHPTLEERRLRAEDIIVVAPYNAQRTLLQQALGPDVRVGTVDKFQGQEAPVAILSLTASSREDLPRGLEFLLDPHRMNVAISRARALALVVASPALLATSAESVREMRLLNDLCRIAHRSGA